jgi:hypothetical protein
LHTNLIEQFCHPVPLFHRRKEQPPAALAGELLGLAFRKRPQLAEIGLISGSEDGRIPCNFEEEIDLLGQRLE